MKHIQSYYFGSFGLVRGRGPMYRTIAEADACVRRDARNERANGGTSDRNVVLVSRLTGLCWWADESEASEPMEKYLIPVRNPDSSQARYPLEVVHQYETLWRTSTPEELAGLG